MITSQGSAAGAEIGGVRDGSRQKANPASDSGAADARQQPASDSTDSDAIDWSHELDFFAFKEGKCVARFMLMEPLHWPRTRQV